MDRYDQPGVQATTRFGLVQIVHLPQVLYIGQFKVVAAVLDLGLEQDIAVGVDAIPVNLPHRSVVLQEHYDAFQPVGQFHRYGVERKAARLLKVGVLGDL